MNPFFMQDQPIFLLLIIWTLFWKGCALWFASKDNKRGWFWVLLIVNLFGLLEIIYIFHISKRKWADVKALFAKKDVHTTTVIHEGEVPKAE